MTNELPVLGVGATFPVFNYQKYLRFLSSLEENIDVVELIISPFLEEEMKKAVQDIQVPIIAHCTWLSLGTDTLPNREIVKKISDQIDYISPVWWGDHICFNGVPEVSSGTLLPPILTKSSLDAFVRNTNSIKKEINSPLFLENVPFLFNPLGEIDPFDFLKTLIKRTDSGLILGIENIVESYNYYPIDYQHFLNSINPDHVVEIHCPVVKDEIKQNEYNKILEYAAKIGIKPKAFLWQLKENGDGFPEEAIFNERVQWARKTFFSEVLA
ncbi:multinuclear nonheme iron-dependent oxidase [Halobacillus litoralis]|uniref:DUF692 domain-containing protein n=1 Tax=Halobacillus litoralis TaxID=45668 RepID=A0A410MJ31_9BACI|nr:DUF692 family multinuclear iron-containing protein [Halobacillus litoralis]QAS54739.1 hypothetical protein HLI_21005 [Halobacillus litoralis]